MSREEILQKVNEVFQDVLDNNSLQITNTTNSYEIEEWDSLTHIQLVAGVEKKFNLVFKLLEIGSFENVGDMCNCIESKLK